MSKIQTLIYQTVLADISEEVIKLKPHWLVWLCTVNLALDRRCLRKLTIIGDNLAVICLDNRYQWTVVILREQGGEFVEKVVYSFEVLCLVA